MATLEIVEGPGAGRLVMVERPLVVGRDPAADVVIEDAKVSRRHARLAPDGAGILVEDLKSSNGTFVDGNQVHGRVRLDIGGELVVGVTVLELAGTTSTYVSGVRPIPPALAIPEGRPDFVDRLLDDRAPTVDRPPALAKLADSRVRAQARLAPLAIFALAALIVVIYLANN